MQRVPSQPEASAPEATILITTKNRKDDLRTAVTSCLKLEGRIEILVISDGATDGTPEMLREEFPTVRVVRHDVSKGLIFRRNEGAVLARGPVVFSIDDDAAFTDPRTVTHTLEEFARNPRIGAVAMPYIDVRFSDAVQQRAPDSEKCWVVAHYRGTAHALRRDVFLAMGGYRAQLVHQGEEPEYCIRMMRTGHVTRLGTAPPIHHFESPKRSYARQYFFNARNHSLFAWYHAPLSMLPVQLLGSNVLDLRNSIPKGCLWAVIKGIASGYWASLRDWSLRAPVSPALYRVFRSIRVTPGKTLEELEGVLPTLQPVGPPDARLLAEVGVTGA